MDKYFAITYKFFNSAMNLVDYMEKSSTSLIQLLEDIPGVSPQEIEQKKNYESLLRRINKRSKAIKSDLINTIEKQVYLHDNKRVSSDWFSVMNSELENLNQIANVILDSSHYVDKDGRLQQR
jgi:hypothetical protein